MSMSISAWLGEGSKVRGDVVSAKLTSITILPTGDYFDGGAIHINGTPEQLIQMGEEITAMAKELHETTAGAAAS